MFIRSPPHKLSALSSTLFPHSLLLFPKEHTPPSLLPSIVSHFSSDRQFPTPSSVSQQSCYLSYEISRPLQPFLMDLPGHFPYFCCPSFSPPMFILLSRDFLVGRVSSSCYFGCSLWWIYSFTLALILWSHKGLKHYCSCFSLLLVGSFKSSIRWNVGSRMYWSICHDI